MIGDTYFGMLYTAQTTVYFVFAGAAFWRAWENHLAHHQIRKALIALGCLFLLLGSAQAFRVWGRLYESFDRPMLESAPYFWIQVAATLALIVLFFMLQAPRKDAPDAAKIVTDRAAVVASELEATATRVATELEIHGNPGGTDA